MQPQEVNAGVPEKLAAGKFALYQTPTGGFHITIKVDGEEEERHAEVPAVIVKMMMSGKNPMSMLGLG